MCIQIKIDVNCYGGVNFWNFCNFFHAKIETIRANFNSEDLDRQEETLTNLESLDQQR